MKKRNYLISLLAVVLSLGVLVGCGDKTNTSNEGASVNTVIKHMKEQVKAVAALSLVILNTKNII